MGKGDKKSKKGKIWIGSYGVRRQKKKNKKYVAGALTTDLKKAKTKVEEIIDKPVIAEEKPKKVKKETAPKVEETVAEIQEPKAAKEKVVKKPTAKKATVKKEEKSDEKPAAKKAPKKAKE